METSGHSGTEVMPPPFFYPCTLFTHIVVTFPFIYPSVSLSISFSRSLPASSYISQNHFQQSSETCLDLSRLCVYMQVQTAPVIEGANGKTVRGPRWVKVRAAVLIT